MPLYLEKMKFMKQQLLEEKLGELDVSLQQQGHSYGQHTLIAESLVRTPGVVKLVRVVVNGWHLGRLEKQLASVYRSHWKCALCPSGVS